MTIQEKYKRYLNEPYLPDDYRDELEAMTPEQINDAFYTDLQFGTAGLRGTMGPGSNRMNIYVVRKASVGFARFLLDYYGARAKMNGVVIAHDNRLNSREYAFETARTLASYGIKAYLFDSLRPTPELSFAVRRMKAVGGVMITASHNPKEYNGYKVYNQFGCQLIPSEISGLIEIINHLGFELDVKRGKDPNPGQILILDESVDKLYRQNVRKVQLNKDLDKSNIKIVFTPQHGTSYMNALRLFKHLEYENYILVKEQCYPDPLFSKTKSPNPEEPVAYDLALQYAKKYDADLILCTDPDADRIGIGFKDSKGEYQLYSGNKTGSLLLNYVLSQRKEKGLLSDNGVCFNTIVTSSLGAKICESYGVSCEALLTGFKFIGNRIHYYSRTKEKTFEFGYEESYGYLLLPFVRDKDSLQALVIISEMTNYYLQQGKRLDEVMEEIYQKFGYHHDKLRSIYFKGQTGQEIMEDIMKRLHDNPLTEIGGRKIVTTEDFLYLSRHSAKGEEFIENLPSTDAIKFYFEDGSWVAIRPSGTEPKCKFYYEGTSTVSYEDAKASVEKIDADLMKALDIEQYL